MTKKFAIDCWRLCEKIPESREFDAFCRQLIRCSSSVGANYRVACRAKFQTIFLNKLTIAQEEVDQSIFFLEVLNEINSKNKVAIKRLIDEVNEILSIVVAFMKTMWSKSQKS